MSNSTQTNESPKWKVLLKSILDTIKQMIRKASLKVAAFFKYLKRQHYSVTIFYILIALTMVNITIMTLHLLDPEYQYPILNHSYIGAIYPDQDINGTMYTDIVRIHEFSEQTIEVDDFVVVYNDFNIPEYWVEKVINVDYNAKQIELTYDNVSSITVNYSSIVGVYDHNANIFGTLYYTAKFTRGFILLVISHMLILAAYYFAWIDRKE